MSKISVKFAFALLLLLVSPAASWAKASGVEEKQGVPISNIPPGAASAGRMNDTAVDWGSLEDASKMPRLPWPRAATHPRYRSPRR